jgi:tetratricopeptide (TPR) repeat protein
MKKNSFDLQDVHAIFENQEYQNAYDQYKEIYDQSVEDGSESNFVLYYLAACQNCLGNYLDAAYWINKAIDIDPFDIGNTGYACSIFSNIYSQIEKKIALNKSSESIMKLYNFCRSNGRVTSHLQFIMIRFFIKQKHFEQAKFHLDNALERNPFDSNLVSLRRSIALKEKDKETLLKLERATHTKHLREISTMSTAQ